VYATARENQLNAQCALQPSSDGAARTEQEQQSITHGDGRQHQRQVNHDMSSVCPRKRRRVRIQATMRAAGTLMTRLRRATLKLRCKASLSSGLNQIMVRRGG